MPLVGDRASIPLRASEGDVTFEVDGVRIPEGALYRLREGEHRVIAITRSARSAANVFSVRRQ